MLTAAETIPTSSTSDTNRACSYNQDSKCIIADDSITTHGQNHTAHDCNESYTNQDGFTVGNNEVSAVYEEVDSIHDEYEDPDMLPPTGLQVDAVVIHNDTSAPRSSDVSDTTYDEYDELDAQPPSALQVNAIAVYNCDTSRQRNLAETQHPAVSHPTDSGSEHASASHASIVNRLTSNRYFVLNIRFTKAKIELVIRETCIQSYVQTAKVFLFFFTNVFMCNCRMKTAAKRVCGLVLVIVVIIALTLKRTPKSPTLPSPTATTPTNNLIGRNANSNRIKLKLTNFKRLAALRHRS
jgi:hypothetical protein